MHCATFGDSYRRDTGRLDTKLTTAFCTRVHHTAARISALKPQTRTRSQPCKSEQLQRRRRSQVCNPPWAIYVLDSDGGGVATHGRSPLPTLTGDARHCQRLCARTTPPPDSHLSQSGKDAVRRHARQLSPPSRWLSLLRDKSALPAPPGLLALLLYDSAQY